MPESKHTPGAIRAGKAIAELIADAAGPHVDGAFRDNWIEKTVADIAEIIDNETAAPEMLEALELAYDWMRGDTPVDGDPDLVWGDICNRARAAIAKAKGEE